MPRYPVTTTEWYITVISHAHHCISNQWQLDSVQQVVQAHNKAQHYWCFLMILSPFVYHWGWDKMAAISQTIFSNALSWMKMYDFDWISLRFVRKGPINNIPALVQIMIWRRPGDKPLSEPMMVTIPMHLSFGFLSQRTDYTQIISM